MKNNNNYSNLCWHYAAAVETESKGKKTIGYRKCLEDCLGLGHCEKYIPMPYKYYDKYYSIKSFNYSKVKQKFI